MFSLVQSSSVWKCRKGYCRPLQKNRFLICAICIYNSKFVLQRHERRRLMWLRAEKSNNNGSQISCWYRNDESNHECKKNSSCLPFKWLMESSANPNKLIDKLSLSVACPPTDPIQRFPFIITALFSSSSAPKSETRSFSRFHSSASNSELNIVDPIQTELLQLTFCPAKWRANYRNSAVSYLLHPLPLRRRKEVHIATAARLSKVRSRPVTSNSSRV